MLILFRDSLNLEQKLLEPKCPLNYELLILSKTWALKNFINYKNSKERNKTISELQQFRKYLGQGLSEGENQKSKQSFKAWFCFGELMFQLRS